MMCLQIPSMLQAIHDLGMFYLWHAFNAVPLARVICS
jgi:hypothetical protein